MARWQHCRFLPITYRQSLLTGWVKMDGRGCNRPKLYVTLAFTDANVWSTSESSHLKPSTVDLAWLCVIRARRRAAGGPRTLGPLSQIPTTFANIEDLLMYHRSVASSGEADHSGNLLLRAVLRRAKVRSTQMRLLLTVHCRMPCRVQSRSACSSMLPTPYG